MGEEEVFKQKFLPGIIKLGIITLLIGVLLSFVPALYLYTQGIIPSGHQIAVGFGLIFAAVAAFYFVEPISYYPILGIPGTYMSFLAGNISNMRLPCAAVALESAGVAEGTNKGSIIATIAIAVSIIVNAVILLIGALGGAVVMSNASPSVLHAFDFILPAIFGAIFGQFALRNYKLAGIALAIGVILNVTKVIPGWGVLLVCIFGTVAISRLMWEKGMLGPKE